MKASCAERWPKAFCALVIFQPERGHLWLLVSCLSPKTPEGVAISQERELTTVGFLAP